MKWIMDSTRKTFLGSKLYALELFITATYSIKSHCALIFPVPSFLVWGDGLVGKRSLLWKHEDLSSSP